MRQLNHSEKNSRRKNLSLKLARPDRRISALCFRGSHENSAGKVVCNGRTCICECHPLNKVLPFCIICESRRTDKENQVCRYCSGELV